MAHNISGEKTDARACLADSTVHLPDTKSVEVGYKKHACYKWDVMLPATLATDMRGEPRAENTLNHLP